MSWATASYDSAKSCKNSTGGTAVTSLACTTGSLTAGEWIFISYFQNSSSGSTTVSDGSGSPVACNATTGGSIGSIATGGSHFGGIFCENNASSGTHAITVTFPSSQGFQVMYVDVFSGVNTSGTIDATCKSTTNGTCTTTITPSAINGAVFAIGLDGSSFLSVGTGFTLAQSNTNTSDITEYQIPSSTSAITVAVATTNTPTGIAGLSVPIVGSTAHTMPPVVYGN